MLYLYYMCSSGCNFVSDLFQSSSFARHLAFIFVDSYHSIVHRPCNLEESMNSQ